MSLILDGTSGLSDVDGTAGTPAIRGSDANTGVFFGTDIVGVSTGGSERMRVDASGNVGIGTASPAGKFNVSGSVANDLTTFSTADAATTVLNNVNGVALGRATKILFRNTNFNLAGIAGVFTGFNGAGDLAGALVFGTQTNAAGGVVERARIDSSGSLLVGIATSAGYATHMTVRNAPDVNSFVTLNQAASNPYGQFIGFTAAAPNDTTRYFLSCADNAATRAVIRSNGGLANYSANDANLSDRREKTNFAPAKSYLETLCAIPVQTFNYIDQNQAEDPGLTLGVVAQDVQAVAPELVMESNWGTEEEPKQRLSIYQTDLQYALMKSIQELKAINDAQAQTIESLTARVVALEQA